MKRRCIICGKMFPEGQGIVITRGRIALYFHSKRCAVKFLRKLIEETTDTACLEKLLNETLKSIEEARKEPEKKI